MLPWLYAEAVFSLVSLCLHLPKGSMFEFESAFSTIDGKRNNLVANFLKEPTFEWLWFVDSDLIVPKGALARLLEHDADIVGGIYCTRFPPFFATAGHVLQQGTGVDPLRPSETKGFRIRALSLNALDGRVTEVDLLATGCMLIHRHVLEALEPPWFVSNVGTYKMTTMGQNEDWNFCLRARDHGFRIFCDTGVQCNHVGSWEISPQFARVWREHDRETAGASIARQLTGEREVDYA